MFLELQRGIAIESMANLQATEICHSLGLPSFSEPDLLSKKGANITRTSDQETTNQYNLIKNDGVSTVLHELALGIGIICFGSEESPKIS